jgi:hypothetical protein
VKYNANVLAAVALLLGLAQSGFAGSPVAQRNELQVSPQMQQPEPLPETKPDPAPVREPSREQSPVQQAGPQANADDRRDSEMQSIVGTILKQDGKYVLKAWDKRTYHLDDQDKVKKYEGELVKIIGRLESGTNTIYVYSVQLKS